MKNNTHMSALDLIPLATGRGASEWAQGCKNLDEREALYFRALRQLGFKAAMPDDGWVNWKTQEIHLAYPWFSSSPKPGDMVALGSVSSQTTHYVRLSDRPSVNRSMLTWLPFDWVCKIDSESLLPCSTRRPAHSTTGDIDAGLWLIPVLIGVFTLLYHFISTMNTP